MQNLSLSERILYGLNKTGKKQADLCKYTGCKSSTVSMWCNGKVNNLSSDNALKVSEFLNLNYNWLVTGKGDPEADNSAIKENTASADDSYVLISEYSIRTISDNLYNFEKIQNSKPSVFRSSYFTEQGIDPSCCKRFLVNDDSMQPTLFKGNKVIVNTADTAISDNHVFAILVCGELRFKRLIKLINNDIVVNSDNPQYPQEVIKTDLLKVIGRVIERTGSEGL